MQHSKHVFRAFLLIVFWGIAFLVVRAFLIPRSYGQYGHYRGDNVAEQMAKEPVHGSPQSCAPCHKKQSETVRDGRHAPVPCQDCHEPLAWHADPKTNKKIADMAVNRKAALCERCHQKLEARPASFPQVVPAEHLNQVGGEDGDEVCMQCHTPHDPKL